MPTGWSGSITPCSGPGSQLLARLARDMLVPLIAIALFLGVWAAAAKNIQTSLGELPGPVEVWEQAVSLFDEHRAERAKAAEFYARQDERNAKKLAEDPSAEVRVRSYTGKPTFIDQIGTSLVTVATGFVIASLIAIPLGIVCGMSTTVYSALNPLIQIFKPVSPLAWLPLVTMVVSAVYVSEDPMFAKSFLTSAITVTLCCLWPTVINTTVGVASVSKDLLNVSRVLRLGWFTKTMKIVLPRHPDDVHRHAPVARHRLDGADRRGDAGAEPRPRQIRLGRIPERQFQFAGRIMVAVFAIGLVGFA
jgi:nitrate/nitrite transport system permease protein